MSTELDNRVSVVMPAFNVAPFIQMSIESVLNQSHSKLELIVVDDCSTDRTSELINRFVSIDPRVRVLNSKENLGGAGARNLGLEVAQYRYVAFIDGDDLWHQEKLRRQIDAITAQRAQISYTAIQKVDSKGRPFGATQCVQLEVDYNALLANPLIACSSVLLDYDAVGRPLMPDIRKRQDFAFWLKLLREGAVARGIDDPLTYYRVRPGSLSANKLSAAVYTWRVYRSFESLPLKKALPSFISYAWRGSMKRLNR
ncbi:glycosyltransferase family 2 protein [Microbulbifer halophilus]|uniref:Glycosyltransferase family 2 protein n=1 Tax=Microbulbifer halophilus TaxID=453963 RepID=A0ABW5EFD9_9GAMM|nr:glycosyltransferase family 2 protein [Microbulbifer halophilus]MCW8127950.1 glycosyltransferase family 2 protein [Microbulbifer halophilus]